MNADRRERLRLAAMYNITPEELARIEYFECNHEIYQFMLGKRNSTDHSHKTGLIRGRMDWQLNQAYGILENMSDSNDEFDVLLDALKLYHRHPPAVLALGEKRYGLIGRAVRKKRPLYGPPPGHKEPQRSVGQ